MEGRRNKGDFVDLADIPLPPWYRVGKIQIAP